MGKKSKALNIIQDILVIFLALILGVISGLHLTKWIMGDFANINLNGNDYLPNGKEVALQNMGKPVNKITPLDNYIIAEYYLSQYDSYSVTYDGTAKSGNLGQTIQGSKIKNGNVYFVERVSSGFRQYADRAVIDIDNNLAQCQKGTIKQDKETNVVYDQDITSMTYEQYQSQNSTLLTMASSFIVSDKTLISSNMTQDGIYYTIDLTLDPNKSGAFYAADTYTLSGFKVLEIFSVSISARIDSSQYIHSLTYRCEYKIEFLNLPITVVDESTLTFDYSTNQDIPQLEVQ